MGSIEQHSLKGRRRLRWALVLAAFAVLITACGIAPYATQTITGTGTQGTVSDLVYNDDLYYTTIAACTGAFGGCSTDWYGAFNKDGWDIGSDPSLSLVYTGKVAGAAYQFISVWNWRTSSWFPVDAFHVVATDEITVQRALPQPSTDWLTSTGIGFIRISHIGNFTFSSADQLLGCIYGDCSVVV